MNITATRKGRRYPKQNGTGSYICREHLCHQLFKKYVEWNPIATYSVLATKLRVFSLYPVILQKSPAGGFAGIFRLLTCSKILLKFTSMSLLVAGNILTYLYKIREKKN